MMGILLRAVPNMVRTVQQNFRPEVPIGLLRAKIRTRTVDLGLIATLRLP